MPPTQLPTSDWIHGAEAAALLVEAGPASAAELLLGSHLDIGGMRLRIVEVEAYGGEPHTAWPDPAGHAFRGPTPRNSVLFTAGGHLYLYRIYGIHICANITYGHHGIGGGVLLRGAEILTGSTDARLRRPQAGNAAALARGPGNLVQAAGLTMADQGLNVTEGNGRAELSIRPAALARELDLVSGPRVAVAKAADRPWRFWLADSPAVSPYRRHEKVDLDLLD